MELLDTRRLTGPNLLWEQAGAVIDVRFGEANADAAIQAWREQVRRVLQAVNWNEEQTCVRRFSDGASLAISAPVDALYAATEVNEQAWKMAAERLAGESEPDTDASYLRRLIDEESNPVLLSLLAAAKTRGLPTLRDDDDFSIGLGKGSQTWPVDDLPDLETIDWPSLHGIPVGLITGTNGKTTSVRLAATIARAQGHRVGLSSTDWIAVDDDILDKGDYSGPGGARTVLRDRRVSLALLETARGGLLRRGLALEQANAALITNVAEDHLGEFGVEDVQQLADVKWVVTRALGTEGWLVLNADDPLLVERGLASDFAIIWFSPDPQNRLLETGVGACSVHKGQLSMRDENGWRELCSVVDIPITLNGAAVHNVTNALGVVGLMTALGLPDQSIIQGLRRMRPEDNPGRANLYQINGATVIADFAHNPHGVRAFFQGMAQLPAKRRLVVVGQAGDRSDTDIRELTRAINSIPLDRVIIKKMAQYNRGRADGEVAAIIRDECLRLGLSPECLVDQEQEMDAVIQALDWAQPGDLVILLIHEEKAAVLDYLDVRSAKHEQYLS